MDTVRAQFLACCSADRADFASRQASTVARVGRQRCEETVDGVGARENQPVIFVQLDDGFGEWGSIVGWGDAYCWELTNIGAAVNFYGIHPDVHPAYEAIEARVLGFFGSKDPMVTPEVVTTLRGKLEAAAVSFDFTTFDDADHAFFNDTRADVYDSKAAQEAWQHMLGFFRAALTE